MKELTLTEGKIFSKLVRFALPVLFAMFLQHLYGAIDLWVVGQFGGTHADVSVSAVSTGSQIMMSVTIVITGLAMGITVFVGRMIGAGEKQKAGKIIGSGIFIFIVIAVVLTAVMVIAAPAVARVMQAPVEAFDQTVAYITICCAGSVFIIAYNLVGSIFRGIGDSKMPLVTVAINCALNVAGDLLFVAGLHMGAAGAAIATVIAQAISVVLSLIIIKRRELPFTFSLRDIRPQGPLVKEILRLGAPIALQDLLVSMSFLVVLSIVNGLGLTASAGVGVAERLCGFLMLVPSAYAQSMSAFVAQNIGAEKPDRARKALWYGVASSVAVGIVLGYLTFFHGEVLSGIFAKDTAVLQAAADYLKAYAIDCVFVSFLFCFMGYFNGCGRTTFVMIQGMLGAFLVRLPIAWIVGHSANARLFYIGLSTPASTLVQIVMCLVFFAVVQRKSRQQKQILK